MENKEREGYFMYLNPIFEGDPMDKVYIIYFQWHMSLCKMENWHKEEKLLPLIMEYDQNIKQ